MGLCIFFLIQANSLRICSTYLMIICQIVVIACLCCPQVAHKSVTAGLNVLMGFSEIAWALVFCNVQRPDSNAMVIHVRHKLRPDGRMKESWRRRDVLDDQPWIYNPHSLSGPGGCRGGDLCVHVCREGRPAAWKQGGGAQMHFGGNYVQ